MKTKIVSLILAGMFLFSCGGGDDVSNDEACEKATIEWRKAVEDLEQIRKNSPAPNASQSVKDAHVKEEQRLYNVVEEKITARNIACN